MPFGLKGNIFLLGAISQGIGPILLTPLLTRQLSATEFGEITYVTALASIFGILFSFGLPIVISRSYVLNKASRPSITNWFNKIIYVYMFLSVLLFLINSNSIYLYIIAITLAFSCIQLILPLARAKDKSVSFITISIFATFLPSVTIITNSYLDFTFSNLHSQMSKHL